MTPQKSVHKSMIDFFQQFDYSGSQPQPEQDPEFISYQPGTNEGCYITIGGYEYRLRAGDHHAFSAAIHHYFAILGY